jgi:dolichol-phosphate mannosyltransferase
MPRETSAKTAPIELTIVVPSFNERDNVEPLIERLGRALAGVEWEVVYVDDDSPDGTAAKVRELAQTDRRVRCVQRIGRRGLSTAVIEGMLSSSAPYLAVIDADLQHDETLLADMLGTLKSDGLDIVVGSRYVAGGGIGDWDRGRAAMSRFATQLSRLVVSADLTDPMSGFFMMTRPASERAVRRLSGQGFKILLDLFASTDTPYRFKELPYSFRERLHGESKLDSVAVWEYLMLLLDKLVGRFVPVRFVLFALVGASGIVVHLAVLRGALLAFEFALSQGIATIVAMTSNFALNNILTYRDKRLRGRRFLTGLLSFYAICGVGVVANVGVANAVFEQQYAWWLAGLAGALVGVVWNYAVTSVFTWRAK